jgi:hypothetical protein
MADQRLQEIYSRDGKRRVVIYRRDTGTFFYDQEHFSEHPLELCWIPLRQVPIGVYESQLRAEEEARANVDWLITDAARGIA